MSCRDTRRSDWLEIFEYVSLRVIHFLRLRNPEVFSPTIKMYYVYAAAVLCLIAVLSSAGIAQTRERDPREEAQVVQELTEIAPDAAPTFAEATEALDSQRFDEAEKLYQEVLKKVPDFEPALRRLGYTYVALGRRKEGQELTQKALSKNRSIDNLVGRASSLISSNDPNYQPTQAEIMEALSVGREAWQKSGQTDEDSATIVAEMLMMSRQASEFDKFASTLREKFPNSPMAAYYNAIAIANTGDFDAAEAEMQRAQELGAAPEAFTWLATAINTARDEQYFGIGRFFKYLNIIGVLVAIWALGLLGLFVVGRNLSRKTLRSIEESDPNDITGSAQDSLKKIYRRVISIAGIYYYVSQPVVIFLVIAATLGVFVFFLWVGTIPIKIMLILGLVALLTIFYMIKSLVTRVRAEDPGRALTEAEAPELWRLVRDVAALIKTRPVNEIRITPGAELAVYERGSFRAKVSDGAERILIVGAATLNGFDQNAFRAVLAHEYGHFSNRDTAGGEIAFRVNTDIMRMAESMVAGGTATFYNIGFQFLRVFHFIFRRITHGASRLQEVLADRVAAYYFGPDAFKEGLRHVVRREVEFHRLADNEISGALAANRAIQNLYEITVSEESTQKEIDEEFTGIIERPTTDDDTHPSPQDRFRYVSSVRPSEGEHLHGEVWDLFADRTAITTEMSSLIEKLVRPTYDNSEGSTLGL
jgi:Zn-dependent protease with chaperone function/tetratricopeptide (TPR) repeat protein